VLCDASSTETADELLRDADVAMYRAKALGKRRAVLFTPSMRVDLQARSRLERDLRVAIDRHELVVHHQPIVDIATDRIVGSEALLRWPHPERGLVPPAEFISIAEDTGMILAIGRQVLLEATAQVARWNATMPVTLSVSVNVSAQQLSERTILCDVRDALARSGLPPSLLTLELTETVLVKDIENAAVLLRSLKETGVRLAIDDFGTGYSSLSYLAQLPFDVLKVDKAFVAGIKGGGTTDMRLAASVVALASTLDLETVVEGVENDEQLAAMRALGCTRFQGFLWSPAVSCEEFGAMLVGERSRAARGLVGPAALAVPDPRVAPERVEV
jgi:EAL domain-containing protein (putative c-di-GMP-specific phosphodiesterase class I)